MPEPFPTVGIVTEFIGTGTEEDPLSEDGAWANYGRADLRKGASGNAMPTEEFIVNGMYWTRNTFISPCEAFGCISGGGLGAALEGWRIAFWYLSPTSTAGYLAGVGGGIGKDFFLRRYNGGGFNDFDSLGGIAGVSIPDDLGIRITASAVELWARYSGTWSLQVTSGDTTYRGVFYAAIELEEQGGINELGWGCFGVGVKNRQHIYRWLRA